MSLLFLSSYQYDPELILLYYWYFYVITLFFQKNCQFFTIFSQFFTKTPLTNHPVGKILPSEQVEILIFKYFDIDIELDVDILAFWHFSL